MLQQSGTLLPMSVVYSHTARNVCRKRSPPYIFQEWKQNGKEKSWFQNKNNQFLEQHFILLPNRSNIKEHFANSRRVARWNSFFSQNPDHMYFSGKTSVFLLVMYMQVLRYLFFFFFFQTYYSDNLLVSFSISGRTVPNPDIFFSKII